MQTGCLQFAFPGLSNIRCVFSRRAGQGLLGNISYPAGEAAEKVSAARQFFFGSQKGLAEIAECRQAHGDNLVEAFEGNCPEVPLTEADGMMSEKANLGLLIKTADCQPILVAHRGGRHIMAIHAGWRGNRMKFPTTAIERFCARYGLLPKDLFAVRGPSLGPGSARFENFSGEWPAEFEPWFDFKTRCMDLWALTRHQLNSAGIPPEQIYGIDICTLANREEFFSYRDGKTPGRQGAIIWRSE